jgi:hypothetical protein
MWPKTDKRKGLHRASRGDRDIIRLALALRWKDLVAARFLAHEKSGRSRDF